MRERLMLLVWVAGMIVASILFTVATGSIPMGFFFGFGAATLVAILCISIKKY